ncbi:MBL fold metallo-hydrolase [Lysobacter korlensis]|uniref:MBL fold metallo-hydrolase n=1 Tax=Lysobacter korlensis TaxID=553636 RepID=A0ABV6S245_9GAMM
MLIDGGPPDTWPTLRARLERLDDPYIDVAAVTHIDSDHIGGFLPFVRSPFAHQVGDFWFNARPHLPGGLDGTRSIPQGESLATELSALAPPEKPATPDTVQGETLAGRDSGASASTDEDCGAPLPWNVAFGGGPIESGEAGGFREVPISGAPRITVLSPTTKRLQILGAKWHEAVSEGRRGEEGETDTADVPPPLGDLVAMANETSPRDASAPNGSSIALLVEHRGASALLSGDAFGNVLGAALAGLAKARGAAAIELGALKLPHHGSRGNVLRAMLKLAPARHYIVSTNGDTFHHPDDAAIARTVLAGAESPTISFNYRTPRAERWNAPELRAQYGFAVRFPGDPTPGIAVELEEHP